MTKDEFILAYCIRWVTDIDKLPAAVAMAESLWAELQRLGYSLPPAPAPAPAPARATPAAGGWDGAPVPRAQAQAWLAGGHPGYAKAVLPIPPAPRDWRAEEAHWRRLLALYPGHAQAEALLNEALAAQGRPPEGMADADETAGQALPQG